MQTQRRDGRALTENELVRAFSALARAPNARIALSIGDDAAAWRPSRSHLSVITSDALIEGVHFTRKLSFGDIGHRAMAANLSDIAAMGARPILCTAAIGVSGDIQREELLELFGGMQTLCAPFGCAIVGGDLSRADQLMVCITMVGEVRATHLKKRSGARPGDVIASTGPLGASRAWLDGVQDAFAAHARPVPRILEGRWLAASRSVRAMMDISDGLNTDLARMSIASQCSARIERVPVADAAEQAARSLKVDAQSYAAAGGEDFELLLAIDGRAFTYLADRYCKRFGRPLERIGTFMPEGAAPELQPTGWEHFA